MKLLFLLLILAPMMALAEMTVGGELEFIDPSSPRVATRGLKGYESKMAETFSATLRNRCAVLRCVEKTVRGKWGNESRFLFNDFWIQVSWDPGVVEILTQPLKLSRLKSLAPLMQNAIFETARRSGLETSPKRAGHFNFGARASFENNAELFLKFVVDYSNRPELASGILRSLNMLTAPPLAALSQPQKEALADIAMTNVRRQSIAGLAQMLMENVFFKTTREEFGFSESVHNQALGLKKVPDAWWLRDQPLEVRAVRSQRSIDDLILIAELFEARIAYLKTQPIERVSLSSRVDFTHEELDHSFKTYVTEAGLPYERYRVLLPSRAQTMTCFALFH